MLAPLHEDGSEDERPIEYPEFSDKFIAENAAFMLTNPEEAITEAAARAHACVDDIMGSLIFTPDLTRQLHIDNVQLAKVVEMSQALHDKTVDKGIFGASLGGTRYVVPVYSASDANAGSLIRDTRLQATYDMDSDCLVSMMLYDIGPGRVGLSMYLVRADLPMNEELMRVLKPDQEDESESVGVSMYDKGFQVDRVTHGNKYYNKTTLAYSELMSVKLGDKMYRVYGANLDDNFENLMSLN